MSRRIPFRTALAWSALVALSAPAAEVKLLSKQHDPYGCPRPAPNQSRVPLRSTFYTELGLAGAAAVDGG